jgi:ribA/ribD-fused uncharacterized protein
MKAVYFFGENNPYGEFSQLYRCNFIDTDGLKYNCCEQYMMAEKAKLMGDRDVFNRIMSIPYNPKVYQALGRKVRNFDQVKWETHRYNIVREGNRLKFTQDGMLLDILFKTCGRALVEASPYDSIWGIGINVLDAIRGKPWNGNNLLR